MSEEQGYIRVVNIKGDEGFRPSKDETLIMMDRTNPILGNKHYMRVKSREERERVIEAYSKDLEADFAVGGPMHKTLLAIAKDIFYNGAKIGAGCHCAGAPCHLDVVAEKVREMVQVLSEDKACSVENWSSSAKPKP